MDRIEINRIDKATYTNQNWQEYFEVRRLYSIKMKVPLLFDSWKALKERSEGWINNGIGIYTVNKDGKSIGFFSFDTRLKEDETRRYVYFRNGLMNDLSEIVLKHIYSFFLEFDPFAKYLVIKSTNGKNDFLKELISAELADYRVLFSLDVHQAKIDLIKSWFKEYSAKFEDYELRHYEDIPDSLLNEYCSVFTKLLNDMPNESKIYEFKIEPEEIKRKQKEDKKNHQYSYRYLVFHKGAIIGKTNVYLNKKKPEIMNQYMTGTLKEYRRQGIGKWLKAAMYLKLTKDFPSLKTIKTEIHSNNIASRKLSQQMGFEKTGFEKEWLISRERIMAYL